MRRVLVPAAVTVLALVLVPPATGDRNVFRAAVSFWAMRHTFFDSGAGSYRELEGKDGAARAWPYSQALSATIAMAAVPRRGRLYVREAAQRVSGLSRYLRSDGAYASLRGATGAVYYDDNEWIALELLRWYYLRNAGPALTGAERLFGIVVKVWDSDPSHGTTSASTVRVTRPTGATTRALRSARTSCSID